MFHLAITEASQNSILKSLMMVIMPDIMASFVKYDVCSDDIKTARLQEHHNILEAIIHRDPEGAESMMKLHLKSLKEISMSINL